MNILVIQSAELDPIGILGTHLENQGARLHTWLVRKSAEPPTLPSEEEYKGLIVLGGPMNAHEDDQFPHLRQAVELIQQFHRESKPIMGVCLGAQLIARAFGSQVYPHTVPELGFCAVRTIASSNKSSSEPWLQNCPRDLHLMQWHFDTFALPPQATLLMTNEVCQNQAFRIGHNVYGFQFHLEVTPEIVMNWLQMKNAWIEANYPRLDQQLKEQIGLYSEQSAQFAEEVAKAWMQFIPASALSV